MIPVALPLLLALGGAPSLLLVCQPGGTPLSAAEQGQVQQLADRLSGPLGLVLTARYATTDAECAAAAKERPAVVIPSLRIYLERAQAWSWTPVAVPRGQEGDTVRYTLWAPAGTPPGLGPLTTLRLTGTDLAPAFLERVLFGEKIGATAAEVLALRALRAVKKGQADRVLLDERQRQALVGTPLAEGLVEVWRSEPLPGPPVCLGPGAPKGLGAKLLRVLVELGQTPDARPLLEAFSVTGFLPIAVERYRPLEKKLREGP